MRLLYVQKDNFVYAKRRLGDLEEILKDKIFFRVPESYIIQMLIR